MRFDLTDVQEILEAIPHMAFIADDKGGMIYFNQRHYDYLGVVRGDSEGWRWKEQNFLHPEDLQRTIDRWGHSVRTGEPYEIEYRLRGPDGVYRWHLGLARSMRDEQGKITHWLGTNTDIDIAIKDHRELVRIIENMSDGYFAIDKNWIFVSANRKFEKITGRKKNEIIGQSFQEIFLPQDLELPSESYEYYQRAMKERVELRFETYNRRFALWKEVRVYPGSDGGLAVFFSDISKRKKLEGELVQLNRDVIAEQKKLEDIFQVSPAAMALWRGEEMIFEKVNPVYMDIFGGRDLLGKPLLEAVPELKGQGFDDLLRKVLRTGETFRGVEMKAQIQNPRTGHLEDRYYDFSYLQLKDSLGRPYGVYDHAIDVTEKVKAREAMKDAMDRALRAEKSLMDAVRVAKVGFYDWDIQKNEFRISDQFAMDWGVPKNITLEEAFESIVAEDRAATISLVDEAVKSGKPYIARYRVRRRSDQQVIWIEAQGQVNYDDQGQPLNFIGTSMDVSRQVLYEREIREAKEDAERANSAKSAFLANMSHEMRSPLGAIIGFAELIRSTSPRPEDLESFLAVIDRNSKHLLRIVDEILDLSKVEAGKILVEKLPFSLPDLLGDFSSLMKYRAQDKGIDFRVRSHQSLPDSLESDPTRLRQILNNIVGNAIKFTEKGHVELFVDLKEDVLELKVVDTGLGISPEQAAHLFQAFHQADASTTRKFGGTGLGLVLTRRLCELMGGTFFLESSELGRGSVFVARVKVTVPKTAHFVQTEKLSFVTPNAPVMTERRPLEGVRVLAIEDSPDNQMLFKIALEKVGAQVTIASDGIEGLETATKGDFDIVLCDVQMPGKDGHQTTRELRAQNFMTPIIALTAHAMKEERERAKASGFTDFLSKPVNRGDLIAMVSKYTLQTK